MRDDQLRIHRELEYLAAAGRTRRKRRRTRKKGNTKARKTREWQRLDERRRKMNEVDKL